MLTGSCHLQYGGFPQVIQPDTTTHKLLPGDARCTGAGGMLEVMVHRPQVLLLLSKSNLFDLDKSRHCLQNSCQNRL